MTVSCSFLDELVNRKIRLSLDGEHLLVDAPRGSLTEEIRSVLQEYKADFMEALRAYHSDTICPVCGGAAPINMDGRDFCERHVPNTPLRKALLEAVDLYQSLAHRLDRRDADIEAKGSSGSSQGAHEHDDDWTIGRYTAARQQIFKLQEQVAHEDSES